MAKSTNLKNPVLRVIWRGFEKVQNWYLFINFHTFYNWMYLWLLSQMVFQTGYLQTWFLLEILLFLPCQVCCFCCYLNCCTSRVTNCAISLDFHSFSTKNSISQETPSLRQMKLLVTLQTSSWYGLPISCVPSSTLPNSSSTLLPGWLF